MQNFVSEYSLMGWIVWFWGIRGQIVRRLEYPTYIIVQYF